MEYTLNCWRCRQPIVLNERYALVQKPPTYHGKVKVSGNTETPYHLKCLPPNLHHSVPG